MAPNPSRAVSDGKSSDEIVTQLMQVLQDLKQQGKIVTIQICPQCKSPSLRNREPWYDIGGAMGISPPKYRCLRCGYWGRLVIEATNEDLNETVLDELVNANAENAQKLLNDIHKHTSTKKSD